MFHDISRFPLFGRFSCRLCVFFLFLLLVFAFFFYLPRSEYLGNLAVLFLISVLRFLTISLLVCYCGPSDHFLTPFERFSFPVSFSR